MVTVVDVVTALVVTAKVALVAPAGTVTLPLSGTEATAGLLLEREMTAPPSGAGPLSVTVPSEGAAPATLVGFSAREDRLSGLPSAQNSKKLRDHPLPSPTLLASRRKNLACTLSGSLPS